ncbi:FAD-dependent oxidoreductase, partial [Rubripirellula amarantea]|nr:FAD-dependent oxidoreductase [Rubripirellula amarantea]
QLSIGGNDLETTFGTKGEDWTWHDGGVVELDKGENEIRLKDLTGFDGRCDCIYLTTELESTPPNDSSVLSPWRREQLQLPADRQTKSGYDLVVIGGGYSGMGAALSAARMGCKVALIQDRGVLGGNGSSEVRVWAMGNIRRGKYPRIGEIVEEFADKATKSPGTFEEFGDAEKEALVRAEPNIDLMLNHFAYGVSMHDAPADAPKRIESVALLNTRTGEDLSVAGKWFVDGTGHGWIGKWAGADHEMEEKGRMGMSNMWRWDEATSPTSFPDTPWALDLTMEDFPYPRDHHGQWFWESGFDKDPIGEAEAIRDWNLRAVYGAFNAMKNGDGAADHENAYLSWVAYVGGPRESIRLIGDVVLTQDDVISKREFDDGCVPSTWSIDLHYPKKEYADKFADNPFISVAVHDRRVDRSYGYPVPYRCFYSRNVENLFMAGRCISVTHEALGTVRVMKTCGMMGEVVGKAASICTANQCDPAEVYHRYLPELKELLELPGKARRATPTAPIEIPDDAMDRATSVGPSTGLAPSTLGGLVVDDSDAKRSGNWTLGEGLKPYVHSGYRYASANSNSTIQFEASPKTSQTYQLRLYSVGHDNRSSKTTVSVAREGSDPMTQVVDQRQVRSEPWIDLGKFDLQAGTPVTVTMSTKGADGFVHADAIVWVGID